MEKCGIYKFLGMREAVQNVSFWYTGGSKKQRKNKKLIPDVASNFASVASVAALVAYIAPYSPPSESSSQAVLLHVQMIVGVDSTQLRNWTV